MAKRGPTKSNHRICPNCKTYFCKRIDVILLDDSSYSIKYKCYACQHEWNEMHKLYDETTKGYVSITLPGLRSRSVPLHRWVWEQYYKEKLKPGTEIHHKNWKKNDNRPQNLMKMSSHIDHFRLVSKIPDYETKIKELETEIKRLEKLLEHRFI